jgi:hypothetical protein
LKKMGQEEVVKLLPKPASKGLGSASEEAVETDGAEEDVDAARLRNCCIYGSGGVLLSKRSKLSVLVRARVACSLLSSGVDAASTHGLRKHKRMIKQTRVDAILETPFDFLAQFRHALSIGYEFEVSSNREETFKSVDVAALGSMPTVKSFRHLDEAPHLFIPVAAS